MEKINIDLPYNFKSRGYQKPLISAILSGQYKRAVCVWHRRSGKDKTLINIITALAYERVGSYYYFFPTYNQGRKIIWDGRDRDGFAFLDHIPKQLRAATNNTEMKITLSNGSLFQVIGTDNIDSIVGTNPIGCIFSEYSLQDPSAWEFIRPILRENKGIAIFNYTPRSHNHGYDLYEMAKKNPRWFCEKLTIKDTGVLIEEDMDIERADGMEEDMIQQEFYCSFDAAVIGAYYAKELARARNEERIRVVEYDRSIPVDTWWDLGTRESDTTAIWFSQDAGGEIHFIDCYEAYGEGIAHYVKVLNDRGYRYGQHWGPHDIAQTELGLGKTRREFAASFGLIFNVAQKLKIIDGIESCRQLFPRCWFDEEKCKVGLHALHSYHRQFDERQKVYFSSPVHDWSSNLADAFRTFGVAHGGKSSSPLSHMKRNMKNRF